MLEDPEELGCHGVVSAEAPVDDKRGVITRVLSLIDAAHEFPGFRRLDTNCFYEHIEALKDIWPCLQGNGVAREPVAQCRATVRSRRDCNE